MCVYNMIKILSPLWNSSIFVQQVLNPREYTRAYLFIQELITVQVSGVQVERRSVRILAV